MFMRNIKRLLGLCLFFTQPVLADSTKSSINYNPIRINISKQAYRSNSRSVIALDNKFFTNSNAKQISRGIKKDRYYAPNSTPPACTTISIREMEDRPLVKKWATRACSEAFKIKYIRQSRMFSDSGRNAKGLKLYFEVCCLKSKTHPPKKL